MSEEPVDRTNPAIAEERDIQALDSTTTVDINVNSVTDADANVENNTPDVPDVDVTPSPSANKTVNSNTEGAAHARNASIVSMNNANIKSVVLFVKSTLESIMKSKELKKLTSCQKDIERTLKSLEQTSAAPTGTSVEIDSLLVFEALRSCCRSKIIDIQIKALDCFAKLFSFQALDESLLVNPPDSMASNDQNPENIGITPPPKQKLIDAVIDTICDCFEGENTDSRVELQVVRGLASCILIDEATSCVHGASLLKAIRQIYNIFIFSLHSSNQGIAQATLTQIVTTVFDRIDVKSLNQQRSLSTISLKNAASTNGGTSTPSSEHPLTLQNLDTLNDETERLVDEEENFQKPDDSITDEQALTIKDAFLLFRAMAKISAKPLEDSLDMRSHVVRSKLLSLHTLHSILKDHIDVFLSQNVRVPGKEQVSLVHAVNQYLCLSLARNAASPIAPVYEITLEIMWLIISNLRSEFKREIPVFLTDIYFPIADLKSSTNHQKRYFLSIIQRVCNDPRTLIEFYLNYDCDSHMPNVVELIINYLTKLALTRVDVTTSQRAYYNDSLSKPLATFSYTQVPLLSISNIPSSSDSSQLPFPVDYALKQMALTCMVAFLTSLSSWAHKALNSSSINTVGSSQSKALSQRADSSTLLSSNRPRSTSALSSVSNTDTNSVSESTTNEEVDDPLQFETAKLRKTELLNCVKLFNYKTKKGIAESIKKGFIEDDSSVAIAKWLLNTDGLDLSAVGEYLGEGNEKNISIMHAFVDQFEFTNLSIVSALRLFLQKFRLPGEGQKIDRFMLKFAERFVDQNPNVFSKADTAYVLAYSIILLNTDLHSTQIKKKMTLEEFIENNSGIDNGKDLPREYMEQIFEEISNHEIKLLSEQHQAMISGDATAALPQQSSFGFFNGKDYEREAYIQVSKQISSKTELVFKNLSKNKDTVYYAASHVEHVKSIFETLWMSFLAALTPPFKEYNDIETSDLCLKGIKTSIKIAATFGIDYARASFVGALIQFANLQNLEEIKIKNVYAIITLLEIAVSEGNYMKDSWKDILVIVSQVERLQLISKGVDRETVPDVTQARLANHRSSFESTRSSSTQNFFDRWTRKATPGEIAQEKHYNQTLSPNISKFITSSELVVLIDKIFTNSSALSGSAIVDFIKALTEVSFEEIESSQNATTPRMFSLQKMVDVCYYNMDRIRLEWTPIWNVMGEAFNRIATESNLAVVFFAIDSLRQLSMRFLDIEELTGFEFQLDFLKPFEHTVENTRDIDVQEMCIECFHNFILTKSGKIKSGWKPILKSLQYTAQSPNERIVTRTYELVSYDIVKDHFYDVFALDDSFVDLVVVFKEITKNQKHQKLALHSLETLKRITNQVADLCFKNHDHQLLQGKDEFEDVWLPLLFCFNDTIMTAVDLEVRSRALNYMFDALVANGAEFDEEFWNKICTQLLFPIFGILSKHWEVNQFNSHDDMSVWLSTTLIQALRNMVALFTHYFESLNGLLDGVLGLMVSCICQENDTIARIGRSCLQQLILQNMSEFNDTHWHQVTEAFSTLFQLTTANELFESDPLKQGRRKSVPNTAGTDSTTPTNNTTKESNNSNVEEEVERAIAEENGQDVGNEQGTISNGDIDALPPRRLVETKSTEELKQKVSVKNTIVVKCILQLLMIESLSELFEVEQFINSIPFDEAIKLTTLLERSYEFARDFNDDYELRTRLVEARVSNKIPNLAKQETSSSAVLINILFKLYLNRESSENGSTKEIKKNQKNLLQRLVGICVSIVQRYVAMNDGVSERAANNWRPVIVEIIQGYSEFDDNDYKQQCKTMYDLILQILDKPCPDDLRHVIRLFLTRTRDIFLDSEKV
ncbi:Arf family guanine nucleotide exchange factor SEC7 [Kluyveromyces lactis]|uniref:KLLA0D17358p n=1 Tax=Kluyveromyces lactis (strain ATCC 8585 / CBS 2359 / DSM 70799 / NBRC 1267 / NRRL Y-1140 / WM37) TaxID=284590 RepID=Q6CQG1_KLULA|nr:uncharacterized protein KLLA0_D17358g [Kluyveromyces lactis]CAH00924.1 KLLA0D17358p [Kluyveromyces lactis]|eukprot:XP_453828.1 uncharacterized protein KLLA0_D17358g [Kluyveromyces lactis]